MREFDGKTAFVTGGASGIGLAMGRAFAEAGMRVMLADIPSDVAALVLKAVRDNELYIFTHADMRAPLEARVDRFLTAYRKLGLTRQETKQ
jgi:NAD(P)-dependent dehydrogenase (short-subunit alcohol dehydrogenase family)